MKEEMWILSSRRRWQNLGEKFNHGLQRNWCHELMAVRMAQLIAMHDHGLCMTNYTIEEKILLGRFHDKTELSLHE